jgi:hypothetical protein
MECRLGKPRRPVRVNAPELPDSFKRILGHHDPGMIFRKGKQEIPFPLKLKHILVLSGKDDELVPWQASHKFVKGLKAQIDTLREQVESGQRELGNNQTPGELEFHVYDGVGHEFTDEMKTEFNKWILQFI